MPPSVTLWLGRSSWPGSGWSCRRSLVAGGGHGCQFAVLVSVVAGFVLAAAAAGRRTESAFPRFVGAYGFDVVVYANEPQPRVAKLAEVTDVQLTSPYNGQPTCACTRPINPSNLDIVSATGRPSFRLVSGHLPDPSAPDQVLASFTLKQDYGVRLGTVIHVPLFASSQLSAINSSAGAGPPPKGPTVGLRVVGFEATQYEFPSGITPTYLLYTTRAFAGTVIPLTANYYLYFVRLRHGAADVLRFEGGARSTLNLNPDAGAGYSNQDAQAIAIEASIHPQAVGWWILAALAALVGLAVIGQALARQSVVESEDYPTLAALGTDRRQLVALGTARNLAVALVGAAGAVALATALSPLAPLGEARTAETSTGVAFDPIVLPLGALITVVVVLVVGLWPAMRASQVRIRDDRLPAFHEPSIVARVATAGAPPSMVIGVRHALQRGRGAASVPVGTALFGTVLAVLALSATAVFGASLSNLTTTPKLYGDPFQLNFQTRVSGPLPHLRSLEHNRAVNRITEYSRRERSWSTRFWWNHPGNIHRGPLLFSTVDGHPPNGPGEIGLGCHDDAPPRRPPRLVRACHDQQSECGVPGSISGRVPVIAGGIVSLGTGALITIRGLYDIFCPPGPGQAACVQSVKEHGNTGILASVVPGPRGQEAINRYLKRQSPSATPRVTPTSLVNFGEAVNFPLIFGVMLGPSRCGDARPSHWWSASPVAVEKSGSLEGARIRKPPSRISGGLARPTVALVGVIIGVPLGVVIGRSIWTAFVNNLGAVPVSVIRCSSSGA